SPVPSELTISKGVITIICFFSFIRITRTNNFHSNLFDLTSSGHFIVISIYTRQVYSLKNMGI
ncbi:MAG: hypothetical protein EBY42_10955, partial [Actinobacteria bacterium]|nr:hypothetical protein [Actinomycetota bacterium]